MEKLGKGVTRIIDFWTKVLAIIGSITLTIFCFLSLKGRIQTDEGLGSGE